jgi:hypothetical protein
MVIRRLPVWVYSAIAALPVLILVLSDFAFSFSSPLDDVSRLGLTLTALVWTTIFAFIAWTRLDESGREAHKFAWFYCGGFGLVAALLAVIAVHYVPAGGEFVDGMIARWASKWPVGQGGFVVGVLSAAIAQVVGYAIAWGGWWLAKRR